MIWALCEPARRMRAHTFSVVAHLSRNIGEAWTAATLIVAVALVSFDISAVRMARLMYVIVYRLKSVG